MKKRKGLKKILIGLLVVFIVMQFFRIDTSNEAVTITEDFIELTQPTEEIKGLLKSACYDCHSNETTYPWYSNIAPVSWWMKHHVDEGKEHLNFSKWGTYSEEKQNHKLHECAEEVEEGEMPLSSYKITHGDANLSDDQKELLEEWFESKMTAESHDDHHEEDHH